MTKPSALYYSFSTDAYHHRHVVSGMIHVRFALWGYYVTIKWNRIIFICILA